ncbi:MAG: hypothetical protein ABW318_05875 [Vicinamibacterales bacterium]
MTVLTQYIKHHPKEEQEMFPKYRKAKMDVKGTKARDPSGASYLSAIERLSWMGAANWQVTREV